MKVDKKLKYKRQTQVGWAQAFVIAFSNHSADKYNHNYMELHGHSAIASSTGGVYLEVHIELCVTQFHIELDGLCYETPAHSPSHLAPIASK